MAELCLAKVPDRTPFKPTFAGVPDLNQALADYAALYVATYGRGEAILEVIPATLATFLERYRAFLPVRTGAR